MDSTLRAILSEFFAVCVELDRARRRIAELEAKQEPPEKDQED